MARLVYESNTRVYWATTVANIAAPTVAEIGAAINLSGFVTKDGVNTNLKTNNVDSATIQDSFDAETVGSWGSDLALTMYRDSTADTAWTTCVYGQVGFLIISRFGAPTTGKKVEVYPAQMPPTRHGQQRRERTAAFRGEVRRDGAAEPLGDCRLMPPTLAQILSEARSDDHRRVVVARILIRQDLLRRHDELDAQLTAAIQGDERENREAVAPAIQEQIEALEAEIEAVRVPFKFTSVGRRKWSDLLAAHPPTPEQIAMEREREDGKGMPLDHNPDTFPVAAIAASCIEPAMTLAEVQELEDVLNFSQFNALWIACVDANVGGMESPKSVAAGLIRRMRDAFASTPVVAASPDPYSSDE
jgi:hypothetical protein